jgi:chromosome partitioning protein
MRTIAIINQKGGCGKTTTSINLAACLARLGQRTLLVDMDPQGHCGVGLAVPEEQIERTILDALIEEQDGKPARVSEIVWQIASDFDLAPSNLKLAAFEQIFARRVGREDRLTRALEPVDANYQWCIIDCPPSVGLITFNALRACDEAIVPVETGYFSLHGLAKMMETLEELREKCSKVVNIRVLPTLYDTRTKLAREVLSELRAKFRNQLMESTVNFNTKLKEAASFGQPITEYDPGSRGYKDFVQLARELMGHRPAEIEPAVVETLSRPAELVQRAKNLAQLSQSQFKGTAIPAATIPSSAMSIPQIIPEIMPQIPPPTMPPSFAMTPPAPRMPAPAAAMAVAPEPQTQRPVASLVAEPPMLRLTEPSESYSAAAPRQTLFINPQKAMGFPKTTERKIEEFYGVKQLGSEVYFTSKFEAARQVLIAGDFNNWSPMVTPMHRNGRAGEWTMKLPLLPGRYRYRLVVDGRWMTDPHNKYVEVNQFGELNNIVEVE